MNILEQESLREYIKDENAYDRLVSYFSRHEEIGEEIFPYLGIMEKNSLLYFGEKYSFHSVTKDIFIKRVPFYFYRPDYESLYIGELNQYLLRILTEPSSYEDSNYWIERLYQALEKMHYDYKIDITTIFQYPIEQTGKVSQVEMLFKWEHYLDLADSLNITERTPTHFITAYNQVLEQSGLKPIIYELKEDYNYEYINRNGRIFEMRGLFPCDDNGQPILKWIGVKIKNARKIWAHVDKRLFGSLFVESTPTTVIWGMNCWGTHDDGSDAWYPLYVGPQLMEFDPGALRDIRARMKLSQKQIAEAIGASIRTYQKWESGQTTPDSHHLLRLMNVLDVTDTKEITKWVDDEEDIF